MSTDVIQVVQHLRPGGLEQLALELARVSTQRHHIISLEGSRDEALKHWPRLVQHQDQITFLDKPDGFSATTLLRIANIFRRLRPRAVHSHHIGPLVYTGLARVLAPRCLHVHTEHDAWHLDEPAALRLQKLLLRIARPVHVCVGQHVWNRLQVLLPSTASQVINNGVDTEHFAPASPAGCRAALGLNEMVPIIGCAARLEDVKGIDVLLEAHAQLAPEVQLAIAGTGSQLQAYQRLSTKLGTQDRVHWLGHLDDTRQLYNAVTLYCQPSRNEGLPLAPLEAQACDTPCVLTAVGASDQISGWPGTWQVAANSPGDLAAALASALADPYLADLHPRAEIEKRFGLGTMSAAYDALYRGELA